jgi:drug/metabolite transporter (DMT)-like permease
MPETINRAMTPYEWALLLTLSVLWGSSFLFVGVAVAEVPPFTLVAARLTIAAIVLYVIIKAIGLQLPQDRLSWRDFFIIGLVNSAAPFCLIAWGQGHIASGLASILISTAPLFAIVLAHFATDNEPMTPFRASGVAIGFAGVVVMVGPSALAGLGGTFLPQLALLGAAGAYGTSVVFAVRFARRGVPPLATATAQIAAAAVIILPIAIIADRPWEYASLSAEALAAIGAVAVLSTSLAYIIYYRILSTAGSVNLVLVNFLVPATGVLLGAAVLGERLAPRHFVGMAAIALGLAFVDGRLVNWITKRMR